MMRPALRVFGLLCALGALSAGRAAGEEEPPGVAWFTSLAAARTVAAETGRPLLIAMHVRPRVASPAAALRTRRWLEAYADGEVVRLSGELACVLRVVPAPEGRDPDADAGAPAATHLVIDTTGLVLARLDADVPEGPEAVRRLLRRGLASHGPLPEGTPRIDAGRVARTRRQVAGLSPMQPVAVPLGVPGVRLRLRWELPAPALEGDAATRVQAAVTMRWDGAGPFPIGSIGFGAGEEIDIPVDVRFDDVEGLADLASKGLHRVDVYLTPEAGSFPFSRGPLHVGRVWIELGDGGGGGGAAQEPEAPPEPTQEPPAPDLSLPEGAVEPPEPPPERRTEVVDPFVREGQAVEKEDAVVAVEDPDAGVQPPKQVSLEEALRDFEKIREREVGRAGIAPRERAFLRRYFERLRAAAQGTKRAQKAPK